MADLKPAEVDKARLHFDIYDFDGVGKVDAFYLADLVRSLDLVPTTADVLNVGGAKKKGEKLVTLEEFLPMYSQLKKTKEIGTFEDFSECMKVYDKMENGTMLEAELAHILQSLGEKLNDAECDAIMEQCVTEKPDEDGNIKYDVFIKKLLAGPFPEENADKDKK